MSIKIMAQIWESGPESSSDRFVLLALADFANDDGEAWPSVSSIADKCAMKERGVRQILRRLEADGWLQTSVGGGRHGCSNYRINPAPHAAFSGDKPGTTCPPAPHAPRHESAETRHETAQNPAPHAPEPSRTIKEPSIVKNARDPLVILAEVASSEAATSFIAYRRKSKAKALTVTAANRLAKSLKQIADRGGDPDDALGMAEERGWQSIQADWYFNAQRNGNGQPTGNSGTALGKHGGGNGRGAGIAYLVASKRLSEQGR